MKLLLDKIEKMEQEAKEAENKMITADYERLEAKEAQEGARPEAFVESTVSRVAKARKDEKDRLIHTLLRCGTMSSIKDPDRMMARKQLNTEEDAIRAETGEDRYSTERAPSLLQFYSGCSNWLDNSVSTNRGGKLFRSAGRRKMTVTACNAAVYADMAEMRHKKNVLHEVSNQQRLGRDSIAHEMYNVFKREKMEIVQDASVTKMLKEANAEAKDSESLRTMQALDSISQCQAGLVQVVLSRSTSSGGNQASLGRQQPQRQGKNENQD